MKRLLVFAGCFVILAWLAGCQEGNKIDGASVNSDREFPEFLAGIWKADQHDWVIRFEADGRISGIVHHLWALPIDMNEGGFFTKGPEEGTHALFVMGPCEAEYDVNTRGLKVKLILDHYSIKLPQGSFEGKSHDFFEGEVSEDGTTWKAGWKHYGWLEGAKEPDPNEIEANPVPLVFTKVKAEDLKHNHSSQ